MAEKVKLTRNTLPGLVCPPGVKDILVFDSDLHGFGVRVTKAGAKIFIAQYRGPEGVRRVRLGSFGVVAVEQARKSALVILAEAAQGRDPVGAEQAAVADREAQEIENAFTFEAVVDQWKAARTGDRSAAYLVNASRFMKAHFQDWLTRPARDITRKEALQALTRIKLEVGSTSANRGLAYARAAFGLAVHDEKLEINPMTGIKAPAKERSRDRVLTMTELAVLWRTLDILPDPYAPFIRMLILTFQRREEVARMQWSEISEDGSFWTVPACRSKNGKGHIVHLTAPAQGILAKIGRRGDCPLVFPASTGNPLTAYSHAKEMLAAKFKELRETKELSADALLDWRLHDIRRAGVTALANLKVPPHICDRLLNHISGNISGVAAVYQRAEFLDERRDALETWAAAVTEAVNGKSGHRLRLAA